MLLGRYRDTEGVANDNPKVNARCFVNGDRMAIVDTQGTENSATARICTDHFAYQEFDAVGITSKSPPRVMAVRRCKRIGTPLLG